MNQENAIPNLSETKSALKKLTKVIYKEIDRLRGEWGFFSSSRLNKAKEKAYQLNFLIDELNEKNLPENLTVVNLLKFRPFLENNLTLNLVLQKGGGQQSNSFKNVYKRLQLTVEQRQSLKVPLLKKKLKDIRWLKKNDPIDIPKILDCYFHDARSFNTKEGCTALCYAIQIGSIETAAQLIDAGAALDVTDEDGITALMLAIEREHTEIAAQIINAGAALDITNKYGITALMWAIKKGHTETAVQLIEAGADVNAKDKNGFTALMQATLKGATAIVTQLIETGAELDATDNHGNTALMLANRKGHTDIAAILIVKDFEIIHLENTDIDTSSERQSYGATLSHTDENPLSPPPSWMLDNAATLFNNGDSNESAHRSHDQSSLLEPPPPSYDEAVSMNRYRCTIL